MTLHDKMISASKITLGLQDKATFIPLGDIVEGSCEFEAEDDNEPIPMTQGSYSFNATLSPEAEAFFRSYHTENVEYVKRGERMLDAIKADHKSLIEGKYNRRDKRKRVRDLQAKIARLNAYCKEHNLKIYKADKL